MKFGKNLMRVVETSDPEWGPYWINYKFLKKKVYEIVESKGGTKITDKTLARDPGELSKSSNEVEFFRLLRSELKKCNDFFTTTEQIYRIRKERIWEGFKMLENEHVIQDKNTWTRLLMACVKFYKDVLLVENYAIMNYCGFSKILKKHDKLTGFVTRDAFMRNVMNHQNFTHYPYIMELIRESEQLFAKIQKMESVMPLQDEERLFIEAMRDLNHQASKLQAEEKGQSHSTTNTITNTNTLNTTTSIVNTTNNNKDINIVTATISADNTKTMDIPITSTIPIATVVSTAETAASIHIPSTIATILPEDSTTDNNIHSTTTTTTTTIGSTLDGDVRLSAATLHAYETAQRLQLHTTNLSLPSHLTTMNNTISKEYKQKDINNTTTSSICSSSSSSSSCSSPYRDYDTDRNEHKSEVLQTLHNNLTQKRTATQAGLI